MFPVRAANRAILPVLCRDPELPFAARDAAPWGIGRTAASEALADLIALGFLACAREAAMLGRLARRWACSELPTMDGRGRTVPPSYAARRLSQAEVDAIVAELAAARREARKARDPDAAARAERNLRPPPRTQLSAAADTNSSGSPEPGLVSAAADANAPSEAPLCPHTRTVSISTMVSAQRGRQRSPTELAAGPASPAQKCDRAAVPSDPSLPAAEPARSPIPGAAEDRGRRGEADDDRDPTFEARRAGYIRALGGDPGRPSGLMGGVQRAILADHDARARQPVTPDRLADLLARLPLSASTPSS